MAKKKQPYNRYLKEVGGCFFTASGFYDPRFLQHGYRRYRTYNSRVGFPNMARPVPRYWVEAINGRFLFS